MKHLLTLLPLAAVLVLAQDQPHLEVQPDGTNQWAVIYLPPVCQLSCSTNLADWDAPRDGCCEDTNVYSPCVMLEWQTNAAKFWRITQ